jgi:predicted ester cyclase
VIDPEFGRIASKKSGFADYYWDLQRLLVDDQWLAARLFGTGTHTGTFRGIAASGRGSAHRSWGIYRVADAKIVECWVTWLHSPRRDDIGGHMAPRPQAAQP